MIDSDIKQKYHDAFKNCDLQAIINLTQVGHPIPLQFFNESSQLEIELANLIKNKENLSDFYPIIKYLYDYGICNPELNLHINEKEIILHFSFEHNLVPLIKYFMSQESFITYSTKEPYFYLQEILVSPNKEELLKLWQKIMPLDLTAHELLDNLYYKGLDFEKYQAPFIELFEHANINLPKFFDTVVGYGYMIPYEESENTRIAEKMHDFLLDIFTSPNNLPQILDILQNIIHKKESDEKSPITNDDVDFYIKKENAQRFYNYFFSFKMENAINNKQYYKNKKKL